MDKRRDEGSRTEAESLKASPGRQGEKDRMRKERKMSPSHGPVGRFCC